MRGRLPQRRNGIDDLELLALDEPVGLDLTFEMLCGDVAAGRRSDADQP